MSTATTKPARAETPAANEPAPARNFVTPDVNVYETKDRYVLQAELPGVSKEGLEVTVEGNELTLLGHRGRPELKAESIHRESSDADYRRIFEIDPAIDAGKIEAHLDQGLLTVRLPKSERVKLRTVPVGD